MLDRTNDCLAFGPSILAFFGCLQRNAGNFDPANKMVSDFDLYDAVPTKKNITQQRANAAKRRRSCIGMGTNKKRSGESNKRVSFGVVDVRLFEKKGHMNNTVDLGAIAFNEIHVSGQSLPLSLFSYLLCCCCWSWWLRWQQLTLLGTLRARFAGQEPRQQLPG